MKAGFSKECVNPPLNMPMEGLGQQGGIQSIHDDLFVRALYLEDRGTRALIIGMDLLFFENPFIERLRSSLKSALGLDPAQILLNTSHTHAGPRLTRWSYSGAPAESYLATVLQAVLAAGRAAAAQAVEVTLWAGTAETGLPVSRRRINAQGQAEWAPSRSAEVCRHLPFCLFKDAAERAVALLFSVSCHPSMVYSCDVSADYPGPAMRKLNEHFKTDGALFLQGAGGDTKPRQIAVEEDHWRHGTWEDVAAAGEEVADAVIAKARGGLSRVEPDLRCQLETMAWTLEPAPSREQLERISEDGKAGPSRRAWAQEMLSILKRQGRLPDHAPVALHGLQIGAGLRLVGLAGELVGELGNRILRCYDRGVTFPLGYTDGCVIYLPSDRMLPQEGYEVGSFWEYHWPSRLAPGIDARLDLALRGLQKKEIPNT